MYGAPLNGTILDEFVNIASSPVGSRPTKGFRVSRKVSFVNDFTAFSKWRQEKEKWLLRLLD